MRFEISDMRDHSNQITKTLVQLLNEIGAPIRENQVSNLMSQI
jgi:hypothetical protein